MKSAIERLNKVLSYSEIQAIKSIVDELGEEDSCVINISKVVENVKVTKSVAVSALKLLEATGVIETKSLGMKGTYINVFHKNILKAVSEIV